MNINEIRFEKNEVIALDAEFKRDNMIQPRIANRAIEQIRNYVQSNK